MNVAVQQLSGAFSPEGMLREGKFLTNRPPPMIDDLEARRAAHRVPQSEDCLYLDVWTKGNDGRKRPVMVWFHGGGYGFGSGSAAVSDGDKFTKAGDVVLVTIIHRLNVFGYLHLDGLAGPEFAGSGNAGNLDLIASLEWVRDNIAAFGGDPNNVTIFGESGGGAKTSAMLAMPRAKGLYHKAIVQSGSTIRVTEAAEATAITKLVLAELGIPEDKAAQLQNVEDRKLFDASQVAARKAREAGISARYGPVLDWHHAAPPPAHPV
jgi:para-nitrobenzyl esterase